MNPMMQEPDETVEAVILKDLYGLNGGFTLAQRGSRATLDQDWWYVTGTDITGDWSRLANNYLGWWPLDIRSIVEREFRIYNKNRELVLSLPLDRVKPCKTCGHPLATHHKLHCETENCGYCNGWTCPEHGLVLCGCTYIGGPTPS